MSGRGGGTTSRARLARQLPVPPTRAHAFRGALLLRVRLGGEAGLCNGGVREPPRWLLGRTRQMGVEEAVAAHAARHAPLGAARREELGGGRKNTPTLTILTLLWHPQIAHAVGAATGGRIPPREVFHRPGARARGSGRSDGRRHAIVDGYGRNYKIIGKLPWGKCGLTTSRLLLLCAALVARTVPRPPGRRPVRDGTQCERQT